MDSFLGSTPDPNNCINIGQQCAFKKMTILTLALGHME